MRHITRTRQDGGESRLGWMVHCRNKCALAFKGLVFNPNEGSPSFGLNMHPFGRAGAEHHAHQWVLCGGRDACFQSERGKSLVWIENASFWEGRASCASGGSVGGAGGLRADIRGLRVGGLQVLRCSYVLLHQQ